MNQQTGSNEIKNANEEDKYLFPITETAVSLKMVAVCFADIRGFTTFVDKDNASTQDYAQELLTGFYSAVNDAFEDARKNLAATSKLFSVILECSWPKARKTLGDGVMLVWEYPRSRDVDIKYGFSIFILDFAQLLQKHFYKFKHDFNARNFQITESIDSLDIGIGISSGYAYRLVGFGGENVDYAGTPVNLAARLQDKARDRGIVAEIGLMPNLFLERWSMNNEGEIKLIEVKGIDRKIKVWKETIKETIASRRPRKTDSYQNARALMDRVNFLNEEGYLPFTEDDTMSIFQIREKFEAEFVGDLVELHKKDIVKLQDLQRINPAKNSSDLFHQGIAKLSAFGHSDQKEGQRRSDFIAWAWEATKRVHEMTKESSDEVTRQHTEIYKAILQKGVEHAKNLMREHLQNNCNKCRSKLFSEPEEEKNLPK